MAFNKASSYGAYFEEYYNSLFDLTQRVYNWKNTEYIKQKLNSLYGVKYLIQRRIKQ